MGTRVDELLERVYEQKIMLDYVKDNYSQVFEEAENYLLNSQVDDDE